MQKHDTIKEKGLEIFQEHPQLKKDFKLIKQFLLPAELDALKIIIKNESPISTGSIYNKIIEQVCINEFLKESNNKESRLHNIPNSLFNKWNLSGEIVRRGIFSDVAKPSLEAYSGKKIERFYGGTHPEDNKYFDLSSTETIKIKEVVLRHLKIYFPSYPKVMSTLQRLEKWGFLRRRSDPDSKSHASFYWIINPEFSLAYGDKFKDILTL